MNSKFSKIIHEIRSLFILVIIVLTLKVTIFELYIVPTGSMENTIMTGDFLAGNRFVYGMRTPDWIGIPYTDIGFEIPSIKFPSFQEPKRGDVIIFKFPRDTKQKYVKRCVAGPGDLLEVSDKLIYINEAPYPLPENGKFIMSPISPEFSQQDIFLGKQGNKDHFKPLRMPKRGDKIAVSPENTKLLLHLMLLDGHELSLVNGQQVYYFTMVSPDELYRRKGKMDVYNPYYPQGNKLVPWSNTFPKGKFLMDGNPIGNLTHYTVEQDYYWAMGDNRDDSLDSRYWGFVPKSHILGEALFSYFSLNLNTWIPRFNRIGTIIQ
ncbi:MAG: signal peptidase I [Candidatus Marinimicrobia bacterium]|jgi:signal peptidase I|nr:signal peptidase I [Candidatus Neomarinimicrobiota bacterium]MBT3947092.1 signal peptidase I [Candidatus Neomarinimicrobiota bacterium]MBT4064069.1 signal peptidase I [Candidatus Neomarinimicrobiota bacterium]MBT4307270.1 signal peptidase I [Candidatus Neomarinimicrobiota bacterium]MBT4452735.1 signal peptidase I [Candidatus Neomarinimicrobiota bacterium]|tara:strand:+ start:1689 stop:2651 length:963 start_codon:yes stop_codon:yes gene_type:complete